MHQRKRTATMKFELTIFQNNQRRSLARMLWPDRNEVCRRVLLEGADRMRDTSERLLEAACQPPRRG